MFSFRLSRIGWPKFSFRLPTLTGFQRVNPESSISTVQPLFSDAHFNEVSTQRQTSVAMPEKIALNVADDIQALLICEKIDGQWSMYLTAIEGQKCQELFGRYFAPDERILLSQLMNPEKFELHQRLVADVLNVGPTAHNWTLLFQRMYQRPIKILSPIHQTELIVDIRMELSQEISYEIGQFYQFQVYFNHQTSEQASLARIQKILYLSEKIHLCLDELTPDLKTIPYLCIIIIDLNKEIKDICEKNNNGLISVESAFIRILFCANQIRIQLNMSRIAQEDLKPIDDLNEEIRHLCTPESMNVFSYLNDKIIYEQKIQQALKRGIVLTFNIVKDIYPLFCHAINILDALLSSLIELYALNGPVSKELCLQASVDLKKQFHAKVNLLDPEQKFFQFYQATQNFHELNEEDSHFMHESMSWKNKGGELKVSILENENTQFEFSIFAEPFKPKEFILQSNEMEEFKNILEQIDYQNKKSILFADDGVVNIKFMLKKTLQFLGLGGIPVRSPTSKLDFSKNWSNLACYILSVGDWYFICVPDGRCAQHLLQIWQPDAIITDHQMPHLDGTELIEWFRETFVEKNHVKIALHSASSEANNPKKLADLDAIFLTKAELALFESFVYSVSEKKTVSSVLPI